MSDRIRVYELARELGLSNKELLAILEREGYGVTNHANSLDVAVGDLIRDMVVADRQRKEEAKKKIAGKPAAAPVDRAAKSSAAKDAKETKGAKETKTASSKTTPAKPEKKSAPAKEDKPEASPAVEKPDEAPLTELHLKTPITVRDLAEGLRKKPHELISLMMTMNIFGAINQVLDIELVEKICERHNVKFVRESREKPAERIVKGKADETPKTPRERDLVPRPPVVVFMGHVDHGKTSLQDYIRHTHVTSGEAGGITQHIGASVAVVGDKTITFLDTPGHEAFTAMRARGANATDIAVLVVAADDGVMPQTIEAINHAKAADVPIVVAMNKMDLPAADPEKVLRGLSEHGVVSEDWGGQVAVMPVSALTGEGVNDLLERILLEAEMLDLTAEPKAPFEGLVIEAQMESGMGPIASVLVRNGTLRVGDSLICGQVYGRARALLDSQGKRVPKALPSTPIRIMGLSGVPEAGDIIRVCANEREAKALADEAAQQARQDTLAVDRASISLDEMFNQLSKEDKPELAIVIKADVRGSLEAITESISKLKSDRVSARVIHGGVGEITENDVMQAAASRALILGFHVRAMPGINRLAKQKGVDLRLCSIIYDLLQQVEDAMRGQLQPESREAPLGSAEIIQIFEISKAGKICGCRVTSGVIRVNAKAKVYRDKELIYHGHVASLKHFKNDVREIKSGLECGIRLDNFEDFEVHDIIEAFDLVQVAPQL